MRFYNVISIVPGKEQACVDNLGRLKAECGLDTFAAMAPFHPEGHPLLKKTEEFMARYRIVRDAVAAKGIRGGILVQSLINHGDRATPELDVPFTRIIAVDGTVCNYCFCPLDKGFQDYARGIITLMAQESPEFILLDDDFRMSHHRPVSQGCFCELHMAALNSKFGHNLARNEMTGVLERNDKNAQELGKQWDRVLLDGLMEMSRVIRSAIDAVNPSIRSGACMPGRQAATIAAVVNTLSGNVRPIVRVNNANYMEHAPSASCMVGLQASRMKRYIPEGAEVISESDTCPHHLYSMSANALRHQIAASLLHGTEGAKLWITDLRNGENGEGANYRKMLADSRGFFETLCEFSKTVAWQGPSVSYPPHSVQLPVERNEDNPFAENGCAWGNLLIRLGIPFVEVENAPVRMLSGDAPRRFGKKELESFLHGGLILDGAAARYLDAMGFAEQMGVKVENACLRYSHEYFEPGDPINGVTGGLQLATAHHFEEKRLTPLAGTVHLLSRFMAQPWFQTETQRIVAPAVTLYKNKLGGRIVVFAQPLADSFFLNPKRRVQLAGILDWANCAPLPHAVHDQACAMLYGNIKNSEEHAVAFINYCPDRINPLMLRIPAANELKEIKQLGIDGDWHSIRFNLDNTDLVRLPVTADMRDVIVLKMS